MGRKRLAPPTAFKLEAVSVPCKKNGEGKRRGVNGTVLNEVGRAYPLARDVVERAPSNLSWERLDVLDYIGLEQYLDAKRLSVLPGKGRDFCINTKKLIRLTAHGAFNLRECSWRPLWKLELKKAMDLHYACSPGELVFMQRLDKVEFRSAGLKYAGLCAGVLLLCCCL